MIFRFGDCSFSSSSLRLTRNGEPVRLSGQPLQLLLLLLDRPGRIVTRDEIRTLLWADTTVDFDHSLDVALNRLRATLGDNGKQPRFIETVPRVGYRLVAAVRTEIEGPLRGRSMMRRVALYVLTAILGAFIALAIIHKHYDKFVDESSSSSRIR
jgi:DNA-binding winged helix-turn-helix (wHTH) protein